MSRESFLNRDKVKGTPSHRRARKQERELAGRLGGRCTAGSGNKDEKGDVRIRRIVRVEAKTTKHNSFSVTREMLDKIERAALTADEMPVLVIEFNDGMGHKLQEVAVMPMFALYTLLDNQK